MARKGDADPAARRGNGDRVVRRTGPYMNLRANG